MSLITITPTAAQHFIRLMKQSNSLHLTVSAKPTGCNGYSFDYHFEAGKSGALLVLLNPEARDEGFYSFYVDKSALPFMLGGTIDYVKDGLNSRIKYDLPKAQGSCGCGGSFNF